jgi:hypothetical protein
MEMESDRLVKSLVIYNVESLMIHSLHSTIHDPSEQVGWDVDAGDVFLCYFTFA